MKRPGIYSDIWHTKIVEPIKRNKDGMKWIVHRFPIRNGISLRDAMLIDMCEPNTLLEMILRRAPPIIEFDKIDLSDPLWAMPKEPT